jgi:hypothetical protein
MKETKSYPATAGVPVAVEAPVPAASPAPATPKPVVASGYTMGTSDQVGGNAGTAAAMREYIAQASQQRATPLPDFAPQLSAWEKVQANHLAGFAATDDAGITEAVASFIPNFKNVVAPFQARRNALREEYQNGELTRQGYQLRDAALKTHMETVAKDAVTGPIERRLQATRQHYESWTQIPAPTQKDRTAATTISAELQYLTPARGLARVAEVYRDALGSNDFGVVRALTPHVQSLLERKDSAWHGDADTYALVEQMDTKAQGGWKVQVGRQRVQQVDALLMQLQQITQEAIAVGGDLDKAMSFTSHDGDGQPNNDFVGGKLHQAKKSWPGVS